MGSLELDAKLYKKAFGLVEHETERRRCVTLASDSATVGVVFQGAFLLPLGGRTLEDSLPPDRCVKLSALLDLSLTGGAAAA